MDDDQTPRYDDDDQPQQIDEQQMQELEEMFSRFKTNPDDDSVDIDRLTEILQAFGRNPSLKDSEERINELKMTGKSEVTLEEVLQMLDEQWTIENNERSVVRRALGKFDDTKEGYIDIERFRTAMSSLGEPLADDELDALIQLGLNEEHRKISIEYLLDQLLGDNAG